MLNFVICDDNENSLIKFSQILDLILKNNNLIGQIKLTTPNAYEALDYIKNNIVDVIILDIDLKSDISGLDLAKKIRDINKQIYIIFATAHLEYLISAYKCKTFDYLTKPISFNALESTILRLYNDIRDERKSKSFIKINNKNTLINADSIYFIKKDRTRLIFQTATSEYSTYSSFNKIKMQLPDSFIRCHKSFIVNINSIEEVHNETIFFESNNTIKCYIGNLYKKNFWEVFNKK